VHCSVQNAAVSCVNQRERFTQYLASPSEERETFGPFCEFLVRYHHDVFSRRCVLLVIKTLEDECYVVIKAYKLTVFEILRDFLYCHILRVRAIPTLESTDSMMHILVYHIPEMVKRLGNIKQFSGQGILLCML